MSNTPENTDATTTMDNNFIHKMVTEDLSTGKISEVVTRFPPEPNGYLHIGHCSAIVVDFGTAEKFDGRCNLRFDDTNPIKEDDEFVEAIQEDIAWLGYKWDKLCHASDYFEQLYDWTVDIIKNGDAYVDSSTADEIRELRGNLKEPGKPSPYRDRSVEENLELFAKMRAGDFKEGEHVVRAKIDLANGNMNLRDPIMYRIMHVSHQRTGTEWCIYPTYDWAHGQSDYIEGVTHSLCTIEFSHHNPLYEWFLDAIKAEKPRTFQTEYGATSITYILLSKRNLRRLVEEGHVNGWDDPRMPTLRGLRRLGYTPKALRNFIQDLGVNRNEATVEIERLHHFVRQDLNSISQRVMAVLDPLKVVITNYPEDKEEWVDAINNHEDESAGTRKVPFSREVYIERDDFMEDAPKKFFRLTQGREVRLMHAYYVTCDEVIKDADGNIVELRCSYDPESYGGNTEDGRKVKGTLHWVSAKHALDVEARLYDRLWTKANPFEVEEGEDFMVNFNHDALEVLESIKIEPSVADFTDDTHYQFLRKGYFIKDKDSTEDKLVFNRTIGLRDSWAKEQKKK